MTELHSAAKHESRLRHRTFRRIDEKNYAVYHFKYSFDFSAEVRVSGGIYYIDLDITALNGCVFCENSDSALSFEIARIHDSFSDDLIFMINSALLEHLVNERSFAVVNVRYDRDVAQILANQNDLSNRISNF